MPRLLFEKKGNAVWISHLDLMRLFQRAFKRAGLPLTHTQGYNPRPSVSIALPLSVGVESGCELLDFELDGITLPGVDIRDRLNRTLVEGVRVLDVYDDGRKLKHLAFLDCEVDLEYDGGIPANAQSAIEALFGRDEIRLEKKGKNGVTVQNIILMIRRISVSREDDCLLRLNARVCCQNPSLNPSQLAAAVETYLPEFQPDFNRCRRTELYDTEETIFR